MTGKLQAQTWGRRSFLRHIGAGVLGLDLADHLALEALALPEAARRLAHAKNVLVLYEEGGISQMDSWDPKPDQITEHRSPFAPIATNVPGIRFSSLMHMPGELSPGTKKADEQLIALQRLAAQPRPYRFVLRKAEEKKK